MRSEDQVRSTWTDVDLVPTVSVCCTVFNHIDFLEEALTGFLAQVTTFPFEIIVHDDASTDGSREWLLDLATAYPRLLRIVAQEENQWSRGCRMMLEHMVPLARGRYIALCDGDDFWTDPQKLQRQIEFLDAHADYVLCFSDALGLLQETGKPSACAPAGVI